MANAAQNAPKVQLGKLSPEEAERLAATFRPVWELDDAPFAQGSSLSAAEIDALAGGAGIAPSVRGTQQQQDDQQAGIHEIKTQVSPPPRVPAPDEPKVEIAVEIDVQPDPTPAPVHVAPAQPQAATQPRRSPAAPPAPVIPIKDVGASGEFVPVKKSNTGIILAAVGVVALVVVIFGVKSLMGGSPKSSTAATATAEPTHAEPTATIPPPPPDTAALAPPQTTTTTAVAEPAPPPATTHEAPAAPETHVAVQPPPPATHHTAAAPATTHVAASGGHHAHGGHTAIVRDNPF